MFNFKFPAIMKTSQGSFIAEDVVCLSEIMFDNCGSFWRAFNHPHDPLNSEVMMLDLDQNNSRSEIVTLTAIDQPIKPHEVVYMGRLLGVVTNLSDVEGLVNSHFDDTFRLTEVGIDDLKYWSTDYEHSVYVQFKEVV